MLEKKTFESTLMVNAISMEVMVMEDKKQAYTVPRK